MDTTILILCIIELLVTIACIPISMKRDNALFEKDKKKFHFILILFHLLLFLVFFGICLSSIMIDIIYWRYAAFWGFCLYLNYIAYLSR